MGPNTTSSRPFILRMPTCGSFPLPQKKLEPSSLWTREERTDAARRITKDC